MTYTIEYFSEEYKNPFLKLVHEDGIDIQITYSFSYGRAMITKVTGITEVDEHDITGACDMFEATPILEKACEFHLTGMLVKQMFDHYPRLNDPFLDGLNKEDMIKKLDQESQFETIAKLTRP